MDPWLHIFILRKFSQMMITHVIPFIHVIWYNIMIKFSNKFTWFNTIFYAWYHMSMWLNRKLIVAFLTPRAMQTLPGIALPGTVPALYIALEWHWYRTCINGTRTHYLVPAPVLHALLQCGLLQCRWFPSGALSSQPLTLRHRSALTSKVYTSKNMSKSSSEFFKHCSYLQGNSLGFPSLQGTTSHRK